MIDLSLGVRITRSCCVLPDVPPRSDGCRWNLVEERRAFIYEAPIPRAGRQRTLMEVYGPLWMAPRAGFEVKRKVLSAHVDSASVELNTPSDTPRTTTLDFSQVTCMRLHLVGMTVALSDEAISARNSSSTPTQSGSAGDRVVP